MLPHAPQVLTATASDWIELLHEPEPRPWRHLPTIAGVLAAHVALGWALLQVDAVRQSVVQAAPLLIDFITLAPPKPEVPPPPPPPSRPVVEKPRPAPLITAAPTPAPAPPVFVAEPTPPEPPPPVVAVNTPPEPAPPAPLPTPKTVAATAVQYTRPPAPVYPAMSRRSGESGRVVLRVLIDEKGLPRQITVQQSSGHARLDNAALEAMKDARFRPYTENGVALPVWAPAPIEFDLE